MNSPLAKHYYMIAALLTYVRQDGDANEILAGKDPFQPKQRHMNIVLEQARKGITASALNNARLALQQRLADEVGETFRGVRDITFLSFNYFGHMKPEEFHDMPAPKAGKTTH